MKTAVVHDSDGMRAMGGTQVAGVPHPLGHTRNGQQFTLQDMEGLPRRKASKELSMSVENYIFSFEGNTRP